ncbi:MAG: GIY-YIG nuclease family protein [Lentisphaerae bacterium]|jgi:putative endonuclease|nr:GIY-YIG nuclease family protein [Lentisphaerota bacterium]MBT5610226.1 GIY-YIG nuclease family protein [Lentisphaerota bacterium]MBT7060046.1 GIY-YIG nuclease family protein [Lentisphaerota bacterium]MBT7840624.1 GIY-YIG nuclease family protein [Lentisphaerota bacterium]
MSAWVYILRLRSGQLYVGSTTDLERRWAEHMSGKGGKTTRDDPPVEVAYAEERSTFTTARRREAQIKRWTRAKKEALVGRDQDRLRQLSRSHDHTR